MSLFTDLPRTKVKKTRFNMSHEVKTSIGIGKVVPFLSREVMPGDMWNVTNDFLCRFQPMLAPLMHNVDIRTETYFVPYRLIWKDSSDFFTGGKDGTLEPVKPHITIGVLSSYAANHPSLFMTGSLWDYFGLPLYDFAGGFPIPPETKIDVSMFLGYQLIYQEYYRDQNLTDDVLDYPYPSGAITDIDVFDVIFQLRNRCFEKDYFTGALPFTQRAPMVTIPVGGEGGTYDVTAIYDPLAEASHGIIRSANTGNPAPNAPSDLGVGVGGAMSLDDGTGNVYYDPNGTLKVDTTGTSAASITMEDLRRSSALQRLFEAMARGGARYIEMLLNVFGVASSDSRLQRPEYIGGGKSPLIVSTVLQTSGAFQDGDPVSTTPQGNMAGYGLGGGINHGCHRYFEEHGFILSFMSIRPRTSYQLGIERQWTRFDRFEYPYPQLANLGEQPVYTRELYVNQSLDLDKIFGYVPRYADWKYIQSRVTGEFRDSLDYWDLTRKFADEPVLSAEFMEINQEDMARIFAAGDLTFNQQVIVQIKNNVSVVRRLPKYGIPRLQ